MHQNQIDRQFDSSDKRDMEDTSTYTKARSFWTDRDTVNSLAEGDTAVVKPKRYSGRRLLEEYELSKLQATSASEMSAMDEEDKEEDDSGMEEELDNEEDLEEENPEEVDMDEDDENNPNDFYKEFSVFDDSEDRREDFRNNAWRNNTIAANY